MRTYGFVSRAALYLYSVKTENVRPKMRSIVVTIRACRCITSDSNKLFQRCYLGRCRKAKVRVGQVTFTVRNFSAVNGYCFVSVHPFVMPRLIARDDGTHTAHVELRPAFIYLLTPFRPTLATGRKLFQDSRKRISSSWILQID